MAKEIRIFDVTIAAGTAKATPSTASLAMPPRVVDQVILTFPDGCAGLVGIQLTMNSVPVIPVNDGAFLVGNNRVVSYPLEGYPDSGAWSLTGYNTDVFDHTIHAEFMLDYTTAAAATAAVNVLTPAQLAPVPDAAAAADAVAQLDAAAAGALAAAQLPGEPATAGGT